jgi:hypothetical protein
MTTTYTFLAREQTFRVTLTGLMPLTPHYVYLERQLVTSTNVKPLGKALGDTLVTDLNGQVTFDLYYTADIQTNVKTTYEEFQKTQSLIAGIKEVVAANKSSSTLPADFKDTYFSYAASSITVSVV